MRKPHVILQTWSFSCLTCRHAWESVYEAWYADGGPGGQVPTWRHKGTASMPPWIDPACPACSSLRVKTLPPGARPSGDREDGRPSVPPQRGPDSPSETSCPAARGDAGDENPAA